MPVFVMLTRLAPGALKSPKTLETLERKVSQKIHNEVPNVEWLSNYAVLGPYDYVDIFRAPDIESATKVSALVRTFGHAHTEIWPATDWERFKETIRDLPQA